MDPFNFAVGAYARYQVEGLPIGRGSIEATCEHLVKQLYDIAEARWPRAKTGNILALCLVRVDVLSAILGRLPAGPSNTPPTAPEDLRPDSLEICDS